MRDPDIKPLLDKLSKRPTGKPPKTGDGADYYFSRAIRKKQQTLPLQRMYPYIEAHRAARTGDPPPKYSRPIDRHAAERGYYDGGKDREFETGVQQHHTMQHPASSFKSKVFDDSVLGESLRRDRNG